jgi:hypothetical protein
MTIKYTNIFHSKAIQNLPKFGFLVRKYTIWQPRRQVLTGAENGVSGQGWVLGGKVIGQESAFNSGADATKLTRVENFGPK